METGLRLLMDDGTVHIHFHPKLTPEHYSELFRVAEKVTTQVELREAVVKLANEWGSTVEIDQL